MRQKPSVTTDLNVTPAGSLHDAKPPPLMENLTVHAEAMVLPLLWPPGMALSQNKFAPTVKHKGKDIALEGHDIGAMIPHYNVMLPFPPNVMLLIHIPQSSRKMMLSASTVKMCGAATGISGPFALPAPMMMCGSPSLPTTMVLTNVLNTVNVGCTAGDYIAGYAAIAISIVGDLIVDALGGDGESKLIDDIVDSLLGSSGLKELIAKNVVGLVAGGVKILATGEGSLEVGVGSTYGGGKLAATRSQDGEWSFSTEGSVGWGKGTGTLDSKGVTPSTTRGGLFGPTTSTFGKDADGGTTITETTTEYDYLRGTSTTTTSTRKVDGDEPPPADDVQSALLDGFDPL